MRGFNGRRFAEKKRFLMYFAYAVGVSVLHTLVVFLLNEFGNTKAIYYPGVGDGKCFLRGKHVPEELRLILLKFL